jgi:hypothetical protein
MTAIEMSVNNQETISVTHQSRRNLEIVDGDRELVVWCPGAGPPGGIEGSLGGGSISSAPVA